MAQRISTINATRPHVSIPMKTPLQVGIRGRVSTHIADYMPLVGDDAIKGQGETGGARDTRQAAHATSAAVTKYTIDSSASI